MLLGIVGVEILVCECTFEILLQLKFFYPRVDDICLGCIIKVIEVKKCTLFKEFLAYNGLFRRYGQSGFEQCDNRFFVLLVWEEDKRCGIKFGGCWLRWLLLRLQLIKILYLYIQVFIDTHIERIDMVYKCADIAVEGI